MNSAHRRALAALWSLPGIGLKTLTSLLAQAPTLDALLDLPAPQVLKRAAFTSQARTSLSQAGSLAHAADALERRLAALGHGLAFVGDPAYPPRLAETRTAPPLLFHVGPGAAATPRRRVALVGTRHPDSGYARRAHQLALAVAQTGLGVVSGAAEGIDTAAHHGALDAGGETWAFLGSAIEQVDPAQRSVVEAIVAGGGTVFSEFPPGARPDRSTFPRRNRLISGAADAVLVVRAGATSGALHTARYALEQGRPLLAMPGDFFNPSAEGCNRLLQRRDAQVCLGAEDLVRAVGLSDALGTSGPRQTSLLPAAPPGGLPGEVLGVLERTPLDFDAITARLPGISSGKITAALMELQLLGAVVQKPGSRYEKL